MLQQTRVDQVINYYIRFMEYFPSPEALAKASEDQVLKLWQGLGYYSRARNIHKAAKIIISEHDGKFPETHKMLKTLPGIGEYTAGAIASIAFNEPVPAVDGNVQRVIARLFGVLEPVNSVKGTSIIKNIAEDIMAHDAPGAFNQALMDLGALICKPKSPLCDRCPLQNECIAFKKSMATELPYKVKRTTSRNRFFHYLVFLNPKTKTTYFSKRDNKNDIWYHLYEFPLLETEKPLQPDQIRPILNEKKLTFPEGAVLKHFSEKFIHVLSHQKIHAHFFVYHTSELKNNLNDWLAVDYDTLNKLPTHSLTIRFTEYYDF
jgi:A/G-specific adenine glycosylase